MFEKTLEWLISLFPGSSAPAPIATKTLKPADSVWQEFRARASGRGSNPGGLQSRMERTGVGLTA